MDTIKLFSNGDSVKVWQNFLNLWQPEPGIKVDGRFGPVTYRLTMKWQDNWNKNNPDELILVDGIVGPKTWDKAMKFAAKLGIVLGVTAIGSALAAIISSSKEPRDKIVAIAKTQLGVQDPNKYWSDVQPALMNSNKAWCGGFALWVLHQANVAKNIIWQIGKGFTAINGLRTTKEPKPGDIAYIDQPFQHHAIVESFDPQTGIVKTIDGNQEGSTVKTRERNIKNITAIYSIEPFLNTANV